MVGPRQLRPGQSVFALVRAFSTLPVAVEGDPGHQTSELLFPRHYKDLIRQAAVAENIPSEIALSIIRQESAFNPGPAVRGCLRVMQLLPSVAKELARGTEVPYADAEDLFDPDINVPLGGKRFKSLLSRLRPAVHSRGGGLQRQWLGHPWLAEDPLPPDALEFIEEIPYDEPGPTSSWSCAITSSTSV